MCSSGEVFRRKLQPNSVSASESILIQSPGENRAVEQLIMLEDGGAPFSACLAYTIVVLFAFP